MTTPPRPAQAKGYGHLGRGLDEQVLGRMYDHQVVMRLLKYVKPHWKLGVFALFGMAGYIATMIAQPLVIAWGINQFITPAPGEESQWGNIHIVAIVLLAVALAQMVFNSIQYVTLSRLGVNVLYDIWGEMFRHLQDQSMSFYDRNEVGRVMSRVQNDVGQLQQFMDVGLVSLGDVVMLFFVAAAMVVINPLLAVVTLSVVPVLIVISAFWQRYATRAFVRVRNAISAVNGSLNENISGVRVAQSFNRQALNLKKFDALNKEHRDATVQAGYASGLLMPGLEVMTVLALGLVIVVGGMMVYSGRLDVGMLVAFLLFIYRFFDPLRQITMQYTMFQRAMVAGQRIFEVLDVKPEMKDRPDAKVMPTIQGRIRFENVGFAYIDDHYVLHDITLEVQPGETVALVGATGAGKTTTVSLVTRFYDVSRGRITIDGIDIRDVTRKSLSTQMSMVLQEPFLFSASVKENIRYAHREVSDEQVVAAAKAVGAHDFIMRLEHGYDTVLHQRGGNLSMGQRQLISFARAIVGDPRILILDEATANIDSHTESIVQEALKRVLTGRTSIVIAHRLSTITGADKIVVMEKGRIVEMGTHHELVAKGGVYAGMYAMNFTDMLAADALDGSQEKAGQDTLAVKGAVGFGAP